MQYGFVIDNRKCIGCHACTTACKSEHDVPIGVNRTWVKQVETGTFPNSRRLFSVMRCNHCSEAPCVEICPVEALFFRDDGIVDFDKRRCIGCKSCMQACPYDALYIDPETHTAAKCNYCAHRIDVGLEPACVNVCPEEAIVSGDLDDPGSKIARLVAEQEVTVRKAAAGTQPNLFYIDGDEAILDPMRTEQSQDYFWNAQSRGVGHFAKAVEKLAFSNDDVVEALLEPEASPSHGAPKTVEVLMGKEKRVYDSPNKGILWGWEVSGYVFTKALAAGIFMVALLGWETGNAQLYFDQHAIKIAAIAMGFLLLTGALLVKDLDQPGRFLYVLLRPQWRSWLTRGGYIIAGYGGLLTFWALAAHFNWGVENILMWMTGVFAALTAIYTAYLFRQAKGRDFWGSPVLPLHMLVHSVLAGTAALALLNPVLQLTNVAFLEWTMIIAIAINAISLMAELLPKHETEEAQRSVNMILRGRYQRSFWLGTIGLGIVVPIAGVLLLPGQIGLGLASVALLVSIYITEHIWVEAPQRIQLT